MINYKFIWAYSKVVLWTYDCECVSSKEEQILSGGLESRVQFVECKDEAVHVFFTSVWWLCITIFMKRRIGPKWCVITNTREVTRDVGYWAHYTKGLFFFIFYFWYLDITSTRITIIQSKYKNFKVTISQSPNDTIKIQGGGLFVSSV